MKRQCQAVYYAFDIIWLNGRDLAGVAARGAQENSSAELSRPNRLPRYDEALLKLHCRFD